MSLFFSIFQHKSFRIFFKNQAPSVFYVYWPLTWSWKNSEKSGKTDRLIETIGYPRRWSKIIHCFIYISNFVKIYKAVLNIISVIQNSDLKSPRIDPYFEIQFFTKISDHLRASFLSFKFSIIAKSLELFSSKSILILDVECRFLCKNPSVLSHYNS